MRIRASHLRVWGFGVCKRRVRNTTTPAAEVNLPLRTLCPFLEHSRQIHWGRMPHRVCRPSTRSTSNELILKGVRACLMSRHSFCSLVSERDVNKIHNGLKCVTWIHIISAPSLFLFYSHSLGVVAFFMDELGRG
jgi:hypothetical protein